MPVSNSICRYWRKLIHWFASEAENYVKRDRYKFFTWNESTRLVSDQWKHCRPSHTILNCYIFSLAAIHFLRVYLQLCIRNNPVSRTDYLASVSGEPFKNILIHSSFLNSLYCSTYHFISRQRTTFLITYCLWIIHFLNHCTSLFMHFYLPQQVSTVMNSTLGRQNFYRSNSIFILCFVLNDTLPRSGKGAIKFGNLRNKRL